ncbi:MAG: prolyl oligopeptidase family serine peptidase [Planctomycetales bacterium]|nr:prolyl oligopeptidase family serine peptidase [Planctomycetales bacterium]
MLSRYLAAASAVNCAVGRFIAKHIIATGSVVVGGCVFWVFAAASCAAPPQSPVLPVTDHYHGIPVVDRYRWLEDATLPEVAAWSAAQNAHARRILDALPGADKVRREVRGIVAQQAARYEGLQCVGGKRFCLRSDAEHQQPLLVSVDEMLGTAEQRAIVDPNALDPSGHTTIDWYRPSPDGQWIAVSLSEGGSELGTLHLYDVATGKPMGDTIRNVNSGTAGGSLAWTRDSRGFYYTLHVPGTDGPLVQRVHYHALRSDPAEDRYEMGNDLPAIAEIQLTVADTNEHVLATVQFGDGGQFAHYLRRPDGEWTQFSEFGDGIVQAVFGREDQLYLVSLHDAPRGKLLELSLDQVGIVAPRDLLPLIGESDETIVTAGKAFWGEHTVVPTERHLYVMYQQGGPSTIRAFDKRGNPLQAELVTEPIAHVFDLSATDGDDLVFGITSYLSPPHYVEYHARDNAVVETALRTPAAIDTSAWRVERELARSPDGTLVPMTLVMHKDVVRDGSNPCVVTGYGGYGISNEPEFHASRALWIDRRVIYVVTNLRGGGEFGEAWHAAGMLTHKQNVFDDFSACVRHLIDRNYTRPNRIGIIGGSNGGLLMGATLTQHPELVKAVVSYVGIYDMLRVELSENGKFNVTEFGSVTDPQLFTALYAYSPYHQVVDGVSYPATLFITGENDPRVDPMQSRKMTARLQAATANTVPILLRTSANAGHGGGNSLDEHIEQTVDNAVFLMEQLGVSP